MEAENGWDRGWRIMSGKSVILVLAVVACIGGLIVIGACAVGAYLTAPKVLGAGPDGIDLRPMPGAIPPESALPEEVAGYKRGECQSVTSYRGLALGPDAAEATYYGPDGDVHVVAARLGSYHSAAATVRELAQRVEAAGGLGSHRLLADAPYKGWWSASGKRNFVFWNDPKQAVDRYAFIWQNGAWCFIIASNSPMARRDVTLAFPY
jgi:hypothetical protein